ncbi:MAG: YfiM family protein [Bacteroidia bacterium]|nr:YfiM family protein [Bacteroidia bacterium]
MVKKFSLIFLFQYAFTLSVFSQYQDSSKIIFKRKIIINSVTGIVYSGSLIYLNQLWYQPYKTSHFHFFDDNPEWSKMDKLGHFFTAYYAFKYLKEWYSFAGYKYSDWIAAGITWTYLLNIEILDGFSNGWGFSLGDLASNTLGVSVFLIQNTYVKDFFTIKFSYCPTNYPSYNPMLLGKKYYEQMIKDYNGQTFWLSVSPFYKWNKKLEWLCLSFGYGIDGFVGATNNWVKKNNQYFDYNSIKRYHQYYWSIDIDLSKIKTKKLWLHKLLLAINWVKIPAPALELKGNNLYFRPLLFSN